MPKHSKSPKKQRRSQRKDAGSTTCPDCGKSVRKRGMGSHRARCNKGTRETALDIMADESLALQDAEVELQQVSNVNGELIFNQPHDSILTSVNNSDPPAVLLPAQNDSDDDSMASFYLSDPNPERQANIDINVDDVSESESETRAVLGPLDYDLNPHSDDEDLNFFVGDSDGEFTLSVFRSLNYYGLSNAH
jgi:endogenous inhibitor of DNA gyrase (YacG/DUF329 family)